MPPTVLMNLATISSAVCAEAEAARTAKAASASRNLRMVFSLSSSTEVVITKAVGDFYRAVEIFDETVEVFDSAVKAQAVLNSSFARGLFLTAGASGCSVSFGVGQS